MIRSDELPVPHGALRHSSVSKGHLGISASVGVEHYIAGRTAGKVSEHRKAVEPVTYLAELVTQPSVKCFQFHTHKLRILQNEITESRNYGFFELGKLNTLKCAAIPFSIFPLSMHTYACLLAYYYLSFSYMRVLSR